MSFTWTKKKQSLLWKEEFFSEGHLFYCSLSVNFEKKNRKLTPGAGGGAIGVGGGGRKWTSTPLPLLSGGGRIRPLPDFVLGGGRK